MLKPILPVALSAALILIGGTVHGVRTNRWGYPVDLQIASERMPRLPMTIGDWEGTNIEPSEALTRGIEQGDISAFLQRSYVNRRTGEAVTVFLAMGLTGAMVTHDPRACYGGGGIYQDGPLGHATIPVGAGGESADFLIGNFQPSNRAANPIGVQIYWSFRADGQWKASESPRVDFAPYRALYKVYVVKAVSALEKSATGDRSVEKFISQLLKEMEDVVFSGASTENRVS